ncbi:MAG: ABC transporter permease [Planctomycetaceae bacterium]|nr:ABC transporter permease [Planctomycetaceae bacterium]
MSTAVVERKTDITRKLILFACNHGVWVIFFLIFLLGSGLVPGFLSTYNLMNVLWGNIPFSFMVLGMFIMLLVGQTDLSLESTFAIAPIGGVVLMTKYAQGIVTPWMAIVICLLVGVLAGGINAVISVYLRVNSFLATLTMMLVLRGIAQYLIPEGLYYLPETFIALGDETVAGVPLAVIAFILVAFGIFVLTTRTVFGKNLYAAGSSETAAYLAGLNTKRIRTYAFLLAGFLAALGGLIGSGRMQAVTADMGSGDIMMCFAACFLGGSSMSGGNGEIIGLVGSILTLSIITNLMNLVGVNPFLVKIVYGIILLLAIIFANVQQDIRKRLLLADMAA